MDSQSESGQPQNTKEAQPEEAITSASRETSDGLQTMEEVKDALTSAGPSAKNKNSLEAPEEPSSVQAEPSKGGAVQKVAVNGTKRLFKRPEVHETMADIG